MIYLMIISIPRWRKQPRGIFTRRQENGNRKIHKNKDDTNMQDKGTLTVDKLVRQVRSLEGQEFFMSIPIGGEEHGR